MKDMGLTFWPLALSEKADEGLVRVGEAEGGVHGGRGVVDVDGRGVLGSSHRASADTGCLVRARASR